MGRGHPRPARRISAELTSALRRFERVGWVGLLPGHIARWSVDGRYVASGQAQPTLYLRSVVSGVQHAPPEHPDPLAQQSTEERSLSQPPRGRARRELWQSALDEPDVLLDVRTHCRVFSGR